MATPHGAEYEANIGLKRKEEAEEVGASVLEEYEVVELVLAAWIRIWIVLLLGFVAIPLAVCEIIRAWDQKIVEIRRIGEKGYGMKGSGRDNVLAREKLKYDEASGGASDSAARSVCSSAWFWSNNHQMDSVSWKSDNFSRSREPKPPMSSSPPIEGLSPRKAREFDLPSVYDESDGADNGETMPKTGETSQDIPRASTLKPEPSSKRWERGEGEEVRGRRGKQLEVGKEDGKDGFEWRFPTAINMIQPLPLPNAPGAPCFMGKNVTAFVQLIEDLFEDCRVPRHERRAKIVRYCVRDIRGKIERMPEYRERNFDLEVFYKALRFQYRDRDEFQQKYTVKRLDDAVREGCQLTEDRLEEYLDLFHDISTELTARGVLSRYDRGVKFMKGLPSHLRVRIGERHHFNPMDPESVDYEAYFQTAMRFYRDRRNIRELEDEPTVRQSNEARGLDRPARSFQQEKTYPAAGASEAQKRVEDDLVRQFMGLQLNASEVRSRLNEADEMRREIEDLRRQLNGRPTDRGARNQVVDPKVTHPGWRGILPNPWKTTVDVDSLGPRYGGSKSYGGYADSQKCYMCWNEPGPGGEVFPLHSHVKDCPIYGHLFEIGTCYYNSDQFERIKRGLYWGRPLGKGMRIGCRREEPYWKQVVQRSKGSEYDVNLKDREAYLERLERSRPQMDPHSFDRSNTGPQNPGVTPQETISKTETGMMIVDVLNDDFEDFGRLTYEELAVTMEEEDAFMVVGANTLDAEVLDASAMVTRSKSKRGADSAREVLQDRQQKEAKFAKAKHIRPAAIVHDSGDMDYEVDMDIEKGVRSDALTRDLSEPVAIATGSANVVDHASPEEINPKRKAVRFVERQNGLTEPVAIATGSLKSADPGTAYVNPQRRKGSYKGLTSAYEAGDILLDHFANSKLDITVAQYLATSREGRDFLAKGLKEIEAPEVHRSKADSRTAVDANALSQVGLASKEKPWKYVDGKEEPMGNGERRVYPSPHIPVTIFGEKRGTRLAAMIDSGAAINMISRTLCDRLGFEMQDASEYDMRPVRGPMSGLDGVVDNVPVSVGGMSFGVSFFVMSGANHHCILGQPFKMMSRIRLYGTAEGMDGPEFAELYDDRRRKIIRMQCARPMRRKVTPAKELLGTDYEFDSGSSGEEN